MAQKEFDAFVTIDQNLSYQQNISDLNISIIVLQVKSNRYKELLAYVDLITDVASSTEKGKLYEIFLSTS